MAASVAVLFFCRASFAGLRPPTRLGEASTFPRCRFLVRLYGERSVNEGRELVRGERGGDLHLGHGKCSSLAAARVNT